MNEIKGCAGKGATFLALEERNHQHRVQPCVNNMEILPRFLSPKVGAIIWNLPVVHVSFSN
jgi:hypothetical protein